SPRSGSPNKYTNLFTITLSPFSSVGSMLSPSTIDVANTNVLKKKANKTAIIIAFDHSSHSLFFFVFATLNILSIKSPHSYKISYLQYILKCYYHIVKTPQSS